MRRLLPALAVSLLAVVASSGSRSNYVIFQNTFNGSSTKLAPEVGAVYTWISQIASVKLVADGAGGSALLLDDTQQPSAAAIVIAGAFDNNKVVSAGGLEWSFEVTLGQFDVPFEAGIVVDSPGGDFIPATGPDGEGNIKAFGKKTGQASIVGVPLDVNVVMQRDAVDEDWSFTLKIGEKTDPSPYVTQGRVPNTAGRSVIGIAFQKHPGQQGAIVIDDVLVSVDSPSAKKF